ncbi:MAG: transcriptional repressor [Anaerolineae bacterium]|nr:transcriptional repressor [Anaerolineae bacterium]
MAQQTSPDPRALIRKQGFRLTPQRQMIFDAVRELSGHCTPDEVYARVQRKSAAVNRATVYRTLDFLLKLGLVTTAHIRDNQVIYELAGQAPHHHLVCQHCDKVAVMDHALVQPLFNRIEREYGFEVKTDHFMIFGLCKECREQEA